MKVERLNKLFGLIDLPPANNGAVEFKPLGQFFNGDNISSKEKLTELALEKRTDLLYFDKLIRSSELNVIKAKDEGRSLLNLSGSYGAYGLSDNGTDAYTESFNRQGMEWSVGLNFKMILDKKARGAGLLIARNQLMKATIEKQKAVKSIVLEMDTAYERFESSKQRLKTANKAMELAEERLEQEQALIDLSLIHI